MYQQVSSILAAFLVVEAAITAPALAATPTTVIDLGYNRHQGYLEVCSAFVLARENWLGRSTADIAVDS